MASAARRILFSAAAAGIPAGRDRVRQRGAGHRFPSASATGRGRLFPHARPIRKRRPGQRTRRPDRRSPGHRFRSYGQGILPRRRSQGRRHAARLHSGPGRHRDLAFARVQEQGGGRCSAQCVRRVSRLLGDRLHPGRPPSGRSRRSRRARLGRPRARDENLPRHHRQPHRRRDPLSGMPRWSLSLSLTRRLPVFAPRRRGRTTDQRRLPG